jgi:hypothetical protein
MGPLNQASEVWAHVGHSHDPFRISSLQFESSTWSFHHRDVLDFVDGLASPRRMKFSIYAGVSARAPRAKTRWVGLQASAHAVSSWKQLVGERGFETPTPWSRTRFQYLVKSGEIEEFEVICRVYLDVALLILNKIW